MCALYTIFLKKEYNATCIYQAEYISTRFHIWRKRIERQILTRIYMYGYTTKHQ
jgi:hypothetical protein